MELRQLRAFVTVAEELHFGRAAARLGTVQPAVSQQLGRLERELGVRLLDRSPHRVVLTAAGRRLLGEARAALAGVDRVRDVADALLKGREGAVRIGTTPGLAERLGRGLTAVRALSPDVEVVLVEGSARAHAAAVATGALDTALVREDTSVDGTTAVGVGDDEVVALLPHAHPAASTSVVDVHALADLRLRLPPRRSDPTLHDAVLARCAEVGLVPRRGRDVVSVEDAALEISAGGADWTVVHPSGVDRTSCGTVARPFAPSLTVPVRLLLPAGAVGGCRDALVDAFR
ncbi:LysR family transcriptional regulator [Pseudonocardia endophytica]|uniref:DNA-binding transcriptional LysR family regulator n=1 Tax=Pseudonocardia endophytica TaxID=401976 RepID=A0A4R1HP27_PSEEN|nr:LysR family transcriptional regulator [Pseudonocardia endophytica]TCK22140.1 DNA-binding transcriptional LysR family regulator [Pseudonocardia endophytica]